MYRQCINVLVAGKDLKSLPEVTFSLNQSLGRLVLWGEGVLDEQLNTLITESPNVGNVTLRFLNALATVLMKDILPLLKNDGENFKSPKSAETVRNAEEDLDSLIKNVQHYLESGQETTSDDSDNDQDYDNEDSKDDDIEEVPSCSEVLLSTSRVIDFYVSRLMDLLPAIESLSEIHHNHEYEFKIHEYLKSQALAEERKRQTGATYLSNQQRKRERYTKYHRMKLKLKMGNHMKEIQSAEFTRFPLHSSPTFPGGITTH